jgi:hypothetical protein
MAGSSEAVFAVEEPSDRPVIRLTSDDLVAPTADVV